MSGNTLVVREMRLLADSDLEDLTPRVVAAIFDSAEETGYHQVVAEVADENAELFAEAGWAIEDANTGLTWMEQPRIVITDEGESYPMVALTKVPTSGKRIAHKTLNPELLLAPFAVGQEPDEDAIAALTDEAEAREKLPAWFTDKLAGGSL